MTKRDGRKNNGAVDQGLSEAAYLVRGPAALHEAMKALAEANGQTLAVVWRRAAEAYLAENTGHEKKTKKTA